MKNTVMVVDDLIINIEMLKMILEDDYHVEVAEGGDEAIRRMPDVKPDLVLLDLYMPDIDGFDVIKYMKSHPNLNGIPVIFVTGEKDEFTEEKGLSLGAVDYIKKPYNSDIILVKVRNHLDLKIYRDKLEVLVADRTKKLEERTRDLAAAHEAIIMGMSLMSESHDKVTGAHITRIKKFALMLAQKLSEMYPNMMTEKEINNIAMYSPLHDVGKIAISDMILKKAGVLTPEEFAIMKAHTIYGGDLLRKTKAFLTRSGDDLQVAIDIAECHHERYDGTGYPKGLVGDDIPISARITTLVDTYDALRSPRPYKPTLSHEESFDIIMKGDGRTMPAHFDPRILEGFVAIQDDFAQVHKINHDIETGDDGNSVAK